MVGLELRQLALSHIGKYQRSRHASGRTQYLEDHAKGQIQEAQYTERLLSTHALVKDLGWEAATAARPAAR